MIFILFNLYIVMGCLILISYKQLFFANLEAKITKLCDIFNFSNNDSNFRLVSSFASEYVLLCLFSE